MLEMRPSEFAAFLGISRSRLSNIEAGKLPLSRDMQFILVDKIDGLTLDYLFFGNTRYLTVDFAQRLEKARKRLS
jgi:transcriptional regulator with XRE-family HTH domain